MSKNTDRLGTDKIGKLLYEFSLPAIIGMVVNALYNTVDRMYVGHGVDALGIAGISVSMPLMLVGAALAMLIGIGANSIFSIQLGKGKKDEVEKIMGHAFILLLIVSGFFVIIAQFFLDAIIINVLGASEAILPYAKTYLRIILYGGVFNAMGFGINFFIRSDGHPLTSMYTQLIGAVINIILDPIFIFAFKWGIAGAAWATVIAQFGSFLWVLLYFNSKSTALRFRVRNMKPEWNLTSRILAVGCTPFARQLAGSLIIGLMNRSFYHYGGDIGVTAFGIAYSIFMLISMPLQGLNQGSQPIIGYNYGAKQYSRVRKTYKWTVISGCTFAGAAFVLLQLFPRMFFRIFTRETGELLDVGIRCLRTSMLLLPVSAFQIISSNYFQAIGKPLQGLLLGLSRQVICYIPLLLLLPRLWGLNGVFYAMPFADCISAMVCLGFMLYELKRLGKLMKTEKGVLINDETM